MAKGRKNGLIWVTSWRGSFYYRVPIVNVLIPGPGRTWLLSGSKVAHYWVKNRSSRIVTHFNFNFRLTYKLFHDLSRHKFYPLCQAFIIWFYYMIESSSYQPQSQLSLSIHFQIILYYKRKASLTVCAMPSRPLQAQSAVPGTLSLFLSPHEPASLPYLYVSY